MIRGAPAVSLAGTLPAGIPIIRPVSEASAVFDAQPDRFVRIGDVVLTGLGNDVEAAGAWGASALLRAPRFAIDARGLPGTAAAKLAAGACLRAWRYDGLFTKTRDDGVLIDAIDLVSDDPSAAEAWAGLAPGVTGAMFARDLVRTPSNLLTPATFVTQLTPLVQAGVSVEVLDATALAEGGFGGILAVGAGSVHPPCLIILRWAGTLQRAPVIFVGKGITFDTGGICIKPAEGMWDMRADMAGAAACAGAMLALALRQSPAPAIALLAVAENATGAASYRPGDILRMHDGTTVAVVDTDAEGRLVLADALAYGVKRRPAAIIDVATLTGSIVTALGHEHAGAFGTDDAIANAARMAGIAVGERLWRMPIAEAHRRALDSDVADIRHCVDARGQPDACQAAAFLREFTGEIPWLHLDIAGVEHRAESDGRHAAGPTGFGTRLLDRLVSDRFEAHG